MNIIFLDVDGVLNSLNNTVLLYNKTKVARSGYNYPFDYNCLSNLKYLVDKTKSKLVITSTWRRDKEGIDKLLSELKKYDLDDCVIGYTPVLNTNRSKEIKAYLSTMIEDVNFIILDDNTDMDEYNDHLIKTNIITGLVEEDVLYGIKRLMKK